MDHSSPQTSNGHIFAAICLVAGSCIGGGMLALPVATGVNGFIPSLTIMAVCWFAMTFTALLLIEASLWMEEGVHVITMTSRLLGPIGKAISWVLYLFIAYASLIAYTAGGGMQIEYAWNHYTGMAVSNEVACGVFTAVFCLVLYLGNVIVGRVNTILFLAMIGAYIALISMGVDELKPHLLQRVQWKGSLMAIPLLLTAFSFQTMVPSLTPYLKQNAKALRITVIAGTSLAFLVYALWQLLILGIVPVEGQNGLMAALNKGEAVTQFLKEHVGGKWIYAAAEYFAFFAIVTSFLGIGLGLFDFLADGLRIPKRGIGNIILGLMIALPTYWCATHYERVFLVALDATGGFGDTILNGLIPITMVWLGRYKLGYNNGMRVFGGKPLLIFVGIFFAFSLLLEISVQLGLTHAIYEPYDLLDIPVEEVIKILEE